MYKSNKKPKVPLIFNIFGWCLSISIILTTIFTNQKETLSKINGLIFESTQHELFACAIAWIIYACHVLKSGGVLRKFLCQDFWQPLSKLCLSIYMIHYVYIMNTMDYGKVSRLPGLKWLIHVSIGDIVVSSTIGLILHLFIEAPTVKIIESLFSQKHPETIVNKINVV